jgi:hypothetical protein
MTQQTYPAPSYGQPGQPYGTPPAGFGPPAGPYGYQQPPKKRRTGALVGGIVAALVLVAGGIVGALLLFGPTYIDDAKVEAGVSALTQDNFGVAAADVQCPSHVKAATGGTFQCTATVDGQHATFTVTQKDENGNVGIVTDQAYVPVSTVEGDVSDQVGADAGVDVQTSCDADGHTVLLVTDSTDVACTVTNAEDSSDSGQFTATVAEDGSVTVAYAGE